MGTVLLYAGPQEPDAPITEPEASEPEASEPFDSLADVRARLRQIIRDLENLRKRRNLVPVDVPARRRRGYKFRLRYAGPRTNPHGPDLRRPDVRKSIACVVCS